MKPITVPRTIALVVVALLAALTEAVGPNRYLLSLILVLVWVPFMIWRDMRQQTDYDEWLEVLLNVVMIMVLVHLAPAMWHITAILGAMIVQAPTTIGQPRGFPMYALSAAVLLLGLTISGLIHNPPLWQLTVGCMLGMYPAILLFAHWQARRQLALAARANALEGVRLMTGGVAHDFNNYLTGVLGNAELARSEIKQQPSSPLNELAYKAMENVVRGADKARELARQLLSFSRAEPNARVIVDLGEELSSLIDLLRGVHPANATISYERTDPEPKSLAHGSPVMLQQLFMNLIINATESSTEHVEVQVTISRENRAGDDWLIIAVADNGDGIAPDIQASMFEPFVSSKASGHGLGLAAAREIAHKHGGDVLVETASDNGSCLTVELPAGTTNLKSAANPAAPQIRAKD